MLDKRSKSEFFMPTRRRSPQQGGTAYRPETPPERGKRRPQDSNESRRNQRTRLIRIVIFTTFIAVFVFMAVATFMANASVGHFDF
jgi:hypothetical protein